MIMHASFYNSSSISVRKHILEKIDLKRCELTIDAFMFMAALLSARAMADDHSLLTLFRVHSQARWRGFRVFGGDIDENTQKLLKAAF